MSLSSQKKKKYKNMIKKREGFVKLRTMIISSPPRSICQSSSQKNFFLYVGDESFYKHYTSIASLPLQIEKQTNKCTQNPSKQRGDKVIL